MPPRVTVKPVDNSLPINRIYIIIIRKITKWQKRWNIQRPLNKSY